MWVDVGKPLPLVDGGDVSDQQRRPVGGSRLVDFGEQLAILSRKPVEIPRQVHDGLVAQAHGCRGPGESERGLLEVETIDDGLCFRLAIGVGTQPQTRRWVSESFPSKGGIQALSDGANTAGDSDDEHQPSSVPVSLSGARGMHPTGSGGDQPDALRREGPADVASYPFAGDPSGFCRSIDGLAGGPCLEAELGHEGEQAGVPHDNAGWFDEFTEDGEQHRPGAPMVKKWRVRRGNHEADQTSDVASDR